MIDRALGIEPVVRRKRPDNTSETSSNKNAVNPAGTSPVKPVGKKLYQDEPTKTEEDTSNINTDEPSEPVPKPKPGRKAEKKPTESEEQIASPAVKNIKMARVPLSVDDMKSSMKPHLVQSAKHMEMRNSQLRASQLAAQPQNDNMYKLKLLVFIIVSIGLILFAMTPNRKARGRRN